MATIQDYLEAAKGDIIAGACDRAIALCRHLLEYFPKHIEAHCLLAEAYRERGDSAAAEDLLLRVLSADPESLIARWALSILQDQRGDRDAALGQLRIALEVRPDHAELRKEVVALSGWRAKPSSGGLARLYTRGGLFDRALAEFRAALAREPQRLDLLVGQAEALWRGGRDAEAVEVCRRILEDSPDCLRALLIAGFVEARGKEQRGEAEVRLWQAARALDPENRVAQELAHELAIEMPTDWWAMMRAAAELPDPSDEELRPDLPAPVMAEAEVGGAAAEQIRPAPVEQDRGSSALPAAEGILVEQAWPGLGDLGAELPDENVGADYEALPYDLEIDELARLIEEEERAAATAASANAAPAPAPPQSEVAAFFGGPGLGDVTRDDAPQPDWLPKVAAAVPSPGHGDAALHDDKWGEWADLLNEEITLDPAAEARLSAALAGIQVPQEHEGSGNGTGSASTLDIAEASHGQGAAGDKSLDSEASAALLPYLRALEVDSGDHTARLSLARGYQELGQPEAAVAEYRTLLRLAPQLGGEIANGLRDLLRAQPSHAEAHRALGDANMKIGRFQQAIDEYNQAISLEKVGS